LAFEDLCGGAADIKTCGSFEPLREAAGTLDAATDANLFGTSERVPVARRPGPVGGFSSFASGRPAGGIDGDKGNRALDRVMELIRRGGSL
jgi:hypothetical protein